MLDSITTMFVFLGAVVVAQMIGHKAWSRLTPEQKLALMESTPKVPWSLIFIAVAFGVHSWLADRYGHSTAFLGGFMIVLIVGLLLSYARMLRRFQRQGLPPSYIRTFMLGQGITLLALVFVFWGNYSSMRDMDAESQKMLEEIAKMREDGC